MASIMASLAMANFVREKLVEKRPVKQLEKPGIPYAEIARLVERKFPKLTVNVQRRIYDLAFALRRSGVTLPARTSGTLIYGKVAKGMTYGKLAYKLLQHKKKGLGLPYDEVARKVIDKFPNDDISIRKISWIASQIRSLGIELPDRPRG